MADNPSNNSFIIKALIILYAGGIIYMGYKPVRHEAKDALREMKAWFSATFKEKPPSIKESALLDAPEPRRMSVPRPKESRKESPKESSKDTAKESSGEERRAETKAEAKKRMDQTTTKDRKALDSLVNQL